MKIVLLMIMHSVFAGLICQDETTISINGKTIRTSGNSITISNGTIIVDGKVVSVEPGDLVKGSGNIGTETRELEEFSELRVDISASVTVKSGPKAKCTISADDNILPLIVTECKGKALRITCRESYQTEQQVKVVIETPILNKAEMAGSGEIELSDVTKDKTVLVVSGSGDIRAKGETADLDVTIKGSGNVDADGLKAEKVKVVINGSGKARIHATDSLTTKIRGSGDVIYGGNPTEVRNSLSGSGSVKKQ